MSNTETWTEESLNEWTEECIKFYGIVLEGDYCHWCTEWDFLPIDETCIEFDCCLCYK